MKGHNNLTLILYFLSYLLGAGAVFGMFKQYPDITKTPFYLATFGLISMMFGQCFVIGNLRK